jgi:hypothetical protein
MSGDVLFADYRVWTHNPLAPGHGPILPHYLAGSFWKGEGALLYKNTLFPAMHFSYLWVDSYCSGEDGGVMSSVRVVGAVTSSVCCESNSRLTTLASCFWRFAFGAVNKVHGLYSCYNKYTCNINIMHSSRHYKTYTLIPKCLSSTH